MNPEFILKSIIALVPSQVRDPNGRVILRQVVNLFEGLLYQAKSPYGANVNPQLDEALQLFMANIPDVEKHVLAMMDEIKRQLSAYDDHDGVTTFPQKRLS